MVAPETFDASSSSATASAASRASEASEATQQYDLNLERASISMDEKDRFENSDSESGSSLLVDARELEAQPELHSITSPPEDLVPRRTKIIFVALYLFLNLSLTLSNKSVLSRVSTISPTGI
jgi:hypothetical protein